MSVCSLRRASGVAGVIAAAAVSCGALNGACLPSATDPGRSSERRDTAKPAEPSTAKPAKPATVVEIAPAFSPEILSARVEAQQRLLGEGSLFEDAEGRPVLPTSADSTAEFDESEDQLLDALPGSSGLDADGELGKDVVNGNALGVFVPMENPRGSALTRFHSSLRRLATGTGGAGDKVRVLAYGASHTQADVYTSYLRLYLQQRFGNGGRGFVPLAKANRWHRQPNLRIENSDGVVVLHAQRRDAPALGPFGLMGLMATASSRRESMRVSVVDGSNPSDHGTTYDLHYLVHPEGGRMQVSVDGKGLGTLDTRGESLQGAYHRFTLASGAHSIEVRPKGRGEVAAFGVTVENDRSGVVVDTLGISGTRASNMLRWHEGVWADAVARRDPSLVMFFYGTNEATDVDQRIGAYAAQLREVLRRVQKAAPRASCLIIGPGDFPRKVDEDQWVERPRVGEIVDVQRELAWELGCAFWDARAFMGGVGSMHLWATSKPQMASRDHIHFTRRGYVRLGMALTDALMVDYDQVD